MAPENQRIGSTFGPASGRPSAPRPLKPNHSTARRDNFGGDLHPWLVRGLTLVVLAVGVVVVAATPVPPRLPTVALESSVLYRLEIGTAVMVLTTLVLALLARGLALGRFPTTIGREGSAGEPIIATRDDEVRLTIARGR